jgi:heme/copper-type cytochrome/quinol oxidase subunit 2
MNNDKAIIKALQSTESPQLSADFNSRMMAEVYRAVERKKRWSYVLSLCLISGVSLVLIALTVYLLNNYFSVDFSLHLPKFHFSSESKSIYGFSIYIALLILILIGLDHYFRHKWMIKKMK